MSHFVISVIVPQGTTLEAVMAPFDENLEVPVYVKQTKAQAIEDERASIAAYKASTYDEFVAGPQAYQAKYSSNPAHIAYLRYEFPKRLTWTDDELYAEAIRFTESDELDAEGGILSTYNPETIWDWYTIGGRWTGAFGDDHTTVGSLISRLDEFDANEYQFPRIIIGADGKAVRRGREGWFGFTEDKLNGEEWLAKVRELLEAAPADADLYFVDCHI
jgi:hypothetical protein